MEPRLLQPFVVILGTAAGAYLILCAVALAFQDRLVFFPERLLADDPRGVGLEFEDVTLTTADGLRLHGWFVPHPEARATVLFCHGNAGNISHRLESVRLLHALRLAVLLFDYRGYGRSQGRPSETGTYADAAAAWHHLTAERGLPESTIVLFGRSLGGAVAADLATRCRPAGLIIESTFTTVAELGAAAYPFLPVRQLSRLRYDTLARVRAIQCPKLVVHSTEDDVVPFRMAEELFEAAAPPKRFLAIAGDHNSGFLTSGRTYRDGLDEFLRSLGDR